MRTAAPGPGVVVAFDYQGDAQHGRPAAMTWLIDERRAGSELRLLGVRGENAADVVAAGPFPSSGASTSNVRFDSTITLPRAGCWDITASSGTARADLVVKVV